MFPSWSRDIACDFHPLCNCFIFEIRGFATELLINSKGKSPIYYTTKIVNQIGQLGGVLTKYQIIDHMKQDQHHWCIWRKLSPGGCCKRLVQAFRMFLHTLQYQGWGRFVALVAFGLVWELSLVACWSSCGLLDRHCERSPCNTDTWWMCSTSDGALWVPT